MPSLPVSFWVSRSAIACSTRSDYWCSCPSEYVRSKTGNADLVCRQPGNLRWIFSTGDESLYRHHILLEIDDSSDLGAVLITRRL